MAIAAVLALAGLGVFGGLRAFNNQQTDGLNPEFRQNLVAFVTSEHRASNPDCSIASSKFEAKCVDEADSVIRATLGGMPRELCRKLRALESDGYTFVGVGRCGVPGEGASVHVLLLTPGGERASLFVQVRTPEVNIRSSCRYTSERCRKSGSQMVVWRSDEHIFYFYTADESARARVADAFGVPRANRAL